MEPSVFRARAATAVWCASISCSFEPLSKWTTRTVPRVFSGAATTQTSFEGDTATRPRAFSQVSITSISFRFWNAYT